MRDAAPWTALVVTCRSTLADALQTRRQQLGLNMQQLDDRAGIQGGYSGKLLRPMAPQGRAGLVVKQPCERLPCGDIKISGACDWLMEALDLRLIVVDGQTAVDLGAEPAPRFVRRGGAEATTIRNFAIRKGKRRMSAGCYETAVGLKLARDVLEASVLNHPFVAEHPDLAAKVRDISQRIEELQGAALAAD